MVQAAFEGNELVPLSVAGAVAYFELSGLNGRRGTEENLCDMIDLAVIALSNLAPILRADARGGGAVMSAAQVEELLLSPIQEGRQAPDLEPFYIRRSDLHAAIADLRKAAARRQAA